MSSVSAVSASASQQTSPAPAKVQEQEQDDKNLKADQAKQEERKREVRTGAQGSLISVPA